MCGYCAAPASTFVGGRCASCGPILARLGAGEPLDVVIRLWAAFQRDVAPWSPQGRLC